MEQTHNGKLEYIEYFNIFIKYHSIIDKEQERGELLLMLKDCGFRCCLTQLFSRSSPFVDKDVECQNFDMAISVFAFNE